MAIDGRTAVGSSHNGVYVRDVCFWRGKIRMQLRRGFELIREYPSWNWRRWRAQCSEGLNSAAGIMDVAWKKKGNVGNVQGVAKRKCQRCPAASLRAEREKRRSDEEGEEKKRRRGFPFSFFLQSVQIRIENTGQFAMLHGMIEIGAQVIS